MADLPEAMASLKIGRPMLLGKMSSRKKWNCAMTPTDGSALPVDRDHRFDGHLVGIADIDHAGIDGAGGYGAGGEGIRHRRLQRGFDQRNEVVDKIRQAEIDHRGFQIGHAVLQRGAPNQNARIEFGVECRCRNRT